MKKITLLALSLLLCGVGALKAQFTDLYNFSNSEEPYGSSLLISGNVMYGTSEDGGKNGWGNVFSINKDGSNYKTLWSFDDTGLIDHNSNGRYAYGDLTLIGNRLYGFTYEGGSHNAGEIFSIRTDGSGYKDVWDFDDTGSVGNANGNEPYTGGLLYTSGKLYGACYEGGANNDGTVFSVDTTGKNYKDLFDFNGANGIEPFSSTLILSGKKLFGMTYDGGAHGYGTIFTIDSNGHNFKDLYDFTDNSDGEEPEGALIMSGTKLFGMTYQGGGYSYGSIFSIDSNGKNFKALTDFNGMNGEYAQEDLTLFGTKLYGVSYEGGANNYGTIFSIDTDGNAMTDLFDFNLASGTEPVCNLVLVGGDTLYGMAYEGGAFNQGSIFSFVDSNIDLGINTAKTVAGTIAVYPNPNNGNFTLALSGITEKAVVEVYNMLGEKVFTSAVTNGNNTLNINTQSNGAYLYKVISDNGNLVGQGKLVIQK